jgi:hypothetical protein
MATTTFSVTVADIKKYVPDIEDYGLLDSANDFDEPLQHAENDVLRHIREEWWERYRHTVRYKDITKITTIEMNNALLTPSQWTRSVVYKALAEYIYPILTKWKDPQGGEGADAFQVQMAHYRTKYSEEFQAVLRDGVEYDENNDDVVQTSEKEPIHHLRLIR